MISIYLKEVTVCFLLSNILPFVGTIKPRIPFTKLDLPEPDGPAIIFMQFFSITPLTSEHPVRLSDI